MNNEIKEILDGFDRVLKNYEIDKKVGNLSVDSIYHLFPSEMITIKEYITNLQEENKRLEENPLRGMFANITDDELLIDMGYTNKENEELKQRIDKAIELLEKENYHCPMSLTVEKAYIIEVEKINNVISILRGEDDE